jgi:hypothetical protein
MIAANKPFEPQHIKPNIHAEVTKCSDERQLPIDEASNQQITPSHQERGQKYPTHKPPKFVPYHRSVTT